ncbi:methyltransferase domain protein [Ceratobasidium sp. AG-Ba]|nr:methyltransferase domain protein [Ceratobasidium sp. AG-Ba]
MSNRSCHEIEIDGAPVYFVDDINSDEGESDPEMLIVQGRMFPADANVAISLPQDSAELQRCLNHHRVFKMVLRSNYWGPVEQVLAPIPGQLERKRVLDMVTAEGSWVQEMAQQFPHVDFLSVDNVPLTAHIPRPNIEFEVYDLFNGIVAPDESFDMIHIRQSTAHIRNPTELIRELYRVLKPGGLLLFVDSQLDIFDAKDPKYPARAKYPGLDRGLQIVRTSLAQQGVNPYLWRDLPRLLGPQSEIWRNGPEMNRGKRQVGFRTIRTKAHIFPVAEWPRDTYKKAMGRLAGDTLKGMWRSMEVPFQMYGMDPEVANGIIQGAIGDLERPGTKPSFKTHTIFAFKV